MLVKKTLLQVNVYQQWETCLKNTQYHRWSGGDDLSSVSGSIF